MTFSTSPDGLAAKAYWTCRSARSERRKCMPALHVCRAAVASGEVDVIAVYTQPND